MKYKVLNDVFLSVKKRMCESEAALAEANERVVVMQSHYGKAEEHGCKDRLDQQNNFAARSGVFDIDLCEINALVSATFPGASKSIKIKAASVAAQNCKQCWIGM